MELNVKNYVSRADIKYRDYAEFITLLENGGEIDEVFLSNRILKIFYGLDTKTVRALKQGQLDELLEKISTVIALPESQFKNIIDMGGVTYGFIPNFSEITAGESIDLDDCLERKDFYQLTSILYRPLKGTIDKFGRYEIEEYKGTNDKFKDVTLDIIEGYLRLFTKSFQTLNLATLLSTKQKMEKDLAKMMMEK